MASYPTLGTDPWYTTLENFLGVALDPTTGNLETAAVTAALPALTGDVTSSAGSAATTLKNTGAAGTYGDTTHTSIVTTDAQGRTSAASTSTTQLAVQNQVWTSYTPAWASTGTQPTIGNGVLVGYYLQLGKLLFVNIGLSRGTTTNAGSGVYTLGLPVACPIGQCLTCEVQDVSTGSPLPAPAVGFLGSTTTVVAQFYSTGPFEYGAPNFNGVGGEVIFNGVLRAS